MPDPVALFHECLNKPEPLLDYDYIFDRLIISTSSTSKQTPIMIMNIEIIKRLTAAEVALTDEKRDVYEEQVEKIKTLLKQKDANFIEFTSFWPCLDVSYSAYDKNLSDAEKLSFLREAIEVFVQKRHSIYLSHGYSPTTIQVRKDFEKHKGSGNLGHKKSQALLRKAGFSEYEGPDFLAKPKVYCSVDRAFGKSLIKDLKRNHSLEFAWQGSHQNKRPDLILTSTAKRIFIVEMKHMKEEGGGQGKQMAELISFIKEGETNKKFSYVAFLDGRYFNELISPRGGKPLEQKDQILRYLEANKSNPNYFVNTYGFCCLINAI